MDPLRTDRLLLQPLELSDAEQVQQIFPQWSIVKFLNASVPWPYPPDGAFRFFRDVSLPAIERGEEWHWTIRLRSSPEQIIGAIGLMTRGKTNRGFWLAPNWRNQGLITEAAIATNDYWFHVLGFKLLRVAKAIGNVASRQISVKTGMRLVAIEEQDFVSGKYPTEIWEITAQEWRETKLGNPPR